MKPTKRLTYWDREFSEALVGIRDSARMLLRSNLPPVLLALAFALALGGAAITLTEGRTRETFCDFWTSVWWAIVTMTTVGYGDIVPITPVGRLIGALVMMSGVVLISFFTAIISSLFVASKIREGKGLKQIHYRDHVVVCGFGQLTTRLMDSMLNLASDDKMRVVLIADIPGTDVGELLSRYSSLDLKFVRGD